MIDKTTSLLGEEEQQQLKNMIGYIENTGSTNQQKLAFCAAAIELLRDLKKEIEKKDALHLPTSDDNYPRYPGSCEDALKWLETYWGKYLKFFGAPEDRLFQYQLWKLDERLMSTLTGNRKYRNYLDSKGIRIRDIIPRKTERITREIDEISRDPDAQEAIRTNNTRIKRKNTERKRARQGPV